jgi:YegS/Rv2252/BmrU family lipid kinase
MKKVTIIINPVSGTISKNKIPRLANEILHSQSFQTEIVYTQQPRHASQITQEALDKNVDYIVAAGGDGTVNEVARAMIHTSASLGIIPVGSGNGLARDLGIPMDIRKAIEIIAKGHNLTIDYGKVNEHIFFCTCGVGFDAIVSEKFSEGKRRGSISYAKNAIAEYLKFKPDIYEITLENGTTLREKAFLITCANASQYGNNAYIAPQADKRDGLMDIVVLAPINPFDVGPLAIQLFTKQIDHNQRVSHYRSRKAIIKRSQAGPLHVDGEPLQAGTEIFLEIIPEGLRVITPLNTTKQMIHNPLENIQLFFRGIFQ